MRDDEWGSDIRPGPNWQQEGKKKELSAAGAVHKYFVYSLSLYGRVGVRMHDSQPEAHGFDVTTYRL